MLKVKHRYPFSSALKRMSVLVECSLPAEQKSGIFVFTKGAPEVLAAHMIDIPAFYHETYVHHMTRGKRVLALAYRSVSSSNPSQDLQELRDAPRSKVESDLLFAGFLVFDCDLKADSKSVVRELLNSDHRVIMITGDSAYTAADVALKLGMTRSGAESGLLILESRDESSATPNNGNQILFWKKALGSVTGKGATKSFEKMVKEAEVEFAFDPSKEALKELARKYSLCVTGTALTALSASLCKESKLGTTEETELLNALCPNVTVFARVSPAQKVKLVQKDFSGSR